jgi:RNA polymerase sigma-70 factor, ECF subfamily
MRKHSADEITRMLREWSNGDERALDQLLPIVYKELRRLAASYLRRERSDHTLQPTALVHEAYLRLIGQREARWQNRSQFFAVAAQTMRRVLVDHAKGRHRFKRGGERLKLSLDEAMILSDDRASDLIALDDALNELAGLYPRKSKVVELRYFGGLSVEEIADVLGVSRNTVIRDWSLAKAWLYQELKKGESDDSRTIADDRNPV